MIYKIPHALINQRMREREWREGERKGVEVEMSEKEIRLRWMFPFSGSAEVACLNVSTLTLLWGYPFVSGMLSRLRDACHGLN